MATIPDDLRDVTPRAVFLSPDLTDERARQYLAARGFRDPDAADLHLQQLADDLPTRLALGDLAALLFETLLDAPDPDAALVGFCRYVSTRAPKSSLIGYLHDDPRALQVLTFLLGASPFLTEVLVRNPEYFHWLQRELDGPAPDYVDYAHEIEGLLRQDRDARQRVEALKRFQRREMLRIAGRDLLNKDTLRSSTQQLSTLADAVIEGTLRVVLARAEERDGSPIPGRFTVIGMGKLGGAELNYSSDVDLIFVYEADDGDDRTADERFHRLGRDLASHLAEHTDEGYFYRVDLRLRPMGQRGNVAYSLAQSRDYYETTGETFERFAMIKARPVAGNPELGRRFIEMVQPFVYRRYLDEAAVEELARYKRRSDRERTRRGPDDGNVKSGRGGIREIELFTQVFQLLYGGTRPKLRQSTTLTALASLEELDFLESDVSGDLAEAYVFLRRVEHRLQIVQEGQTHSLSSEPVELTITARRLGFDDAGGFLETLAAHRERVHAIYADLFERRTDDRSFQGRQLFRLLAGELPDDDAVTLLEEFSLPEPPQALASIRSLDDIPSLSHSRTSTRNLLANFLAQSLAQIAACGAPGQVLNRLEHVVSRTGAPAALYRSLLEDESTRHRLISTLDAGDLFSQRLGRYPELFDFLVPASVEDDAFAGAVREGLAGLEDLDLETAMGHFRRLKAIEEFKVLVEWLETRSLPTLNRRLSQLADSALAWATERAGPPGPWVVVALGKLGGCELTVHSDLDLVFLYEGSASDAELYQRQQTFVRQVYTLFETRTSEGVAYEVDTRLRPEGRKGALAIPLESFDRYLNERAERWERMAWTRARVVCGTETLKTALEERLWSYVYGAWDPELPGYARHLRERMERELSKEAGGDRLNLKVGRGGLADIDFILQLLQIRHGETDVAFRIAGTRAQLTALPATSVLGTSETSRLRDAYQFLRTLETAVRIESDASRGWIPTDPTRLDPLAARIGLSPATGQTLLERYRDVTSDVRTIFDAAVARLGA